MKNVTFKLFGFSILMLMIASCSKTVDQGSSTGVLKDAITSSTQNLNNAVNEITYSQAFQLLSVSSGTTLKSGTVYSANIPLSLIVGVYDYKAIKTNESMSYPLVKFFTRSADPAKMVVNMPLAKLQDPRVLRRYLKSDSTLTNNFSMTVTDYHNNYNSYHDYDYVNVADISIDKAKAGSLNIKSVVSPTAGTQYASQFAFSNGYTAMYAYTSDNNSTLSSFSISKANTLLYEEKLQTTKTDTGKFGREHIYTLTIGNVKIVRGPDKTTQVYVNNILQTKAVVAVVDDDDSEDEHSICHKRDIQITFDDGTVSTISQLLSKSITDISTLFSSLHDVYFAAYIVDWIGYDIYYKR